MSGRYSSRSLWILRKKWTSMHDLPVDGSLCDCFVLQRRWVEGCGNFWYFYSFWNALFRLVSSNFKKKFQVDLGNHLIGSNELVSPGVFFFSIRTWTAKLLSWRSALWKCKKKINKYSTTFFNTIIEVLSNQNIGNFHCKADKFFNFRTN